MFMMKKFMMEMLMKKKLMMEIFMKKKLTMEMFIRQAQQKIIKQGYMARALA